MSDFPINNSFSFDQKYFAAHALNSEVQAFQDPIFPQNNFISPQTNINSNHYSNVPQVNPYNDQLNPLSQQGTIIKAQINSFDAEFNSQINNLSSQDNLYGENINVFPEEVKPSDNQADNQVTPLLQYDNSFEKNTNSFTQNPKNTKYNSALSEFITPPKDTVAPGNSFLPPQTNLNVLYNNTNIPVFSDLSSSFNNKELHNNNEANIIYPNDLSNSFPKDNNIISSNVNINIKKNNIDAPLKNKIR